MRKRVSAIYMVIHIRYITTVTEISPTFIKREDYLSFINYVNKHARDARIICIQSLTNMSSSISKRLIFSQVFLVTWRGAFLVTLLFFSIKFYLINLRTRWHFKVLDPVS